MTHKQPWVAVKGNEPRTKASLPNQPAYERTVILREAPPLGLMMQLEHGGRPSS